MRVVLLGDSHLARVRRDVDRIGPDVHNAAVGGSCAADLLPQARSAGVGPDDAVVVSVGSNDAGWRGVPIATFTAQLEAFLDAVAPGRWVYLSPADPPAAAHGARGATLFAAAGAVVVDGPTLLAPLGAGALAEDGLHLTGAAYDVVLPAIRAALEARP